MTEALVDSRKSGGTRPHGSKAPDDAELRLEIAGDALGESPEAAEQDEQRLNWQRIWARVSVLKNHYRLLGVILGLFLALVIAFYILVPPTYTAIAVIGPPGPSPTGSMIAGMGNSVASGLAKKMLGGAGGSSDDPYQDFLQLLPSSRLSQALADRDHLLQKIYWKRWDFENKQWKKPGLVHAVAAFVKQSLNRPAADEPGVDDLTRFFSVHLNITRSTAGTSFGLVQDSPYQVVSLQYDNREDAEAVLSTVLLETDRLIRSDKRRDVLSRISFLRAELAKQAIAADERTALISILSDQEQLLTMIEADSLYASTLVVPPHAALTPTSPPSPVVMVVIAAVLSLVAWILTVMASSRLQFLKRLISLLERRRTAKP